MGINLHIYRASSLLNELEVKSFAQAIIKKMKGIIFGGKKMNYAVLMIRD